MMTECPEAKSYGDQMSKNQTANINLNAIHHFGECIYHKRELEKSGDDPAHHPHLPPGGWAWGTLIELVPVGINSKAPWDARFDAPYEPQRIVFIGSRDINFSNAGHAK